ncbi:hypothetical protein GBA52_028625 [Prunus armeniaca]|nr:hypothetical protein GBA52_028625 [Prunus armeniaca]
MNVGVEPDCATVVSVLPAIGYLKAMVLGRRVHAFVEEKGVKPNSVTIASLLSACGVCICQSMDGACMAGLLGKSLNLML